MEATTAQTPASKAHGDLWTLLVHGVPGSTLPFSSPELAQQWAERNLTVPTKVVPWHSS